MHRHVIVAFITSQIPSDLLASDVVLANTDHDFAATGLRVSSTVRLHRLMTVSATLIQRQLGELSPRLLRDADTKLKALFRL